MYQQLHLMVSYAERARKAQIDNSDQSLAVHALNIVAANKPAVNVWDLRIEKMAAARAATSDSPPDNPIEDPETWPEVGKAASVDRQNGTPSITPPRKSLSFATPSASCSSLLFQLKRPNGSLYRQKSSVLLLSARPQHTARSRRVAPLPHPLTTSLVCHTPALILVAPLLLILFPILV